MSQDGGQKKKKAKMSQDFFEATNKLKIVDYFDNLKNKIDLLVEIFISDNQHDQAGVDEINEAREGWIKEVNECQAHNLAKLEENEDKDSLIADEELFERFCFLINLHADLKTTDSFTGRFISTDAYLRPGQIECFQQLLKFAISRSHYLIVNNEHFFNKGFDKIFKVVETNELVSVHFFFLKNKVSFNKLSNSSFLLIAYPRTASDEQHNQYRAAQLGCDKKAERETFCIHKR
jgi:hypothetical protein